MDVTARDEFYKLLESISEEIKITIFMVSHDLYMVMKSSTSIICLNHHICCTGTPEDLKNGGNFFKNMSEIGLYKHNHDHRH